MLNCQTLEGANKQVLWRAENHIQRPCPFRIPFVETNILSSHGISERAVLRDGTDVDIVIGRMEEDTHLPDHWGVAVYEHPAGTRSPLIESYPLPPEAHDLELQAVADELLSELNEVRNSHR